MSNLSRALLLLNDLLKCFGKCRDYKEIKSGFELSPLGRSALFMAAGRAVESNKHKNQRAFYDPYAHLFSDSLGNKYLNKMSKYAVSYIKFRTLYIDNHIKNIIKKINNNDHIEIVILGVGCDTRSYRMDEIINNPNISVYELDLMDVIEYRYNILIKQNNAQKQIKAKIIPIDVDFRNNEWMNKLVNCGYNKNNYNIWIAEGLFPFLKKQEINNLLENIGSNFCVKGNNKHWMIGNFLNKNTMLQSKLNKLNKQNGDTTCKTGYKRPHSLLEKYGYSQYEIKPIGSLNKKIKTYQQYLECINEHDNNPQSNVKADHFAKSFMFLSSK